MWHIGNVPIKNKVVLAPMASVGNSAYRQIIKEMGAGLIYTEMVSDKAVSYQNKKTLDLLYMKEMERPITQQIFGADKETFVQAAILIYQTMKPDIIDINMGCPVPKVATRAQAGSALLKNPEKVYEIVKAVVKAVPIPVTVKIRSGWDMNHINATEIAVVCEKAGASAIAVHPRTRAQGYSGKADWSIIKAVKQKVGIPVIGNGDIKTPEDAKRMLEETGCDAVMIGRGVLGNPWLIQQTVSYLETGTYEKEISIYEKLAMIRKHFLLLLEQKEEKIAVLEMRTHIAWYVKGMPFGKELKQQIFKIQNKEDLLHVLDIYERKVQNER